MRRLLIRGSGEVGSALARCGFREGYAALVQDVIQPLTSRRRMAFSDALFDGEAVLDGVLARRIDRVAECMAGRSFVAICCLPLDECLPAFAPDVLIDARMRKHVVPESQQGLAPLVIGVGPKFTAGRRGRTTSSSTEALSRAREPGFEHPFARSAAAAITGVSVDWAWTVRGTASPAKTVPAALARARKTRRDRACLNFDRKRSQ